MSIKTRIVPPLDIASPSEQFEELKLRGAIATELQATDQFTVPDRPISDEVREAWFVYRQALRDLSKLAGTTDDKWAAWPERPDGWKPSAMAMLSPPPPTTPIKSQPPEIPYEEWVASRDRPRK